MASERLTLQRVAGALPLQEERESGFLRPSRPRRIRRLRRGPGARTLLALQISAAGVTLLAAGWLSYERVMASERFRVDRVDVRGSQFLSEGEVRELLGSAVGENVLEVDIEALKTRLRASPWVANATVRRTLPDALSVDVEEREPLALAELDQLFLMDAAGVLIDIYGPRTAGFDLPIVRGLKGLSAESRADRAQRAGALLAELAELSAEVSEVHVDDTGELRVVLRGAGEQIRLGAPPYRQRFVTYLGLRAELLARCPDAEYFDLRFRDRIVAKRAEIAGGGALP